MIENSEPALYAVNEALAARQTGAVIEGRIADIRDRERNEGIQAGHRVSCRRPQTCADARAPLERGGKTNIFGSINVADAALAAGAEGMVMISTDKAIEPVSMLGLTKRFAEMYCQALDHDLASQPGPGARQRMRLISVRFGNVLASNGSVVPKFKVQIEAGGPVTVTDPARYFMTIREACDLVITAATHSLAPVRLDVSVYALNMGRPVKIVDLAERMIRLSGLQPGHDIDIVFTGMRPGERLNEILFASEEPTIEIGVAVSGKVVVVSHHYPGYQHDCRDHVEDIGTSRGGAAGSGAIWMGGSATQDAAPSNVRSGSRSRTGWRQRVH